jgi:hypothetical protein
MACHRKFVVPLSRNPTIVESRNRLRTKGGLAVASPSLGDNGNKRLQSFNFQSNPLYHDKEARRRED